MKEWFEDYNVEMNVGFDAWVRFTKVIKVQYDQNANNISVYCIIGNEIKVLSGATYQFRFVQ